MKKNLLIASIIVFVMATFVLAHAISESLGIYTKEVLVVHSYHRDYYHTRVMEEGIERILGAYGEETRIRYEYLDTKNHFEATTFEALFSVMQDKYADVILDGIILTDDDALVFYNTYGKEIWPHTKHVVATGINSLRPYEPGIDGIIIIEERPNVEKTLELALKQNASADIQNLHFIYDNTTTSIEMRIDIEALLLEKYENFNHFHHFEKTPYALKEVVDASDQKDLFIYVLYSRDSSGATYLYDEVPRYILENAVNPVYGLWEFYLGTGIVGGHMASSYKYGEGAAENLIKLWDGQPVPPLIYETGHHQAYMFDHDVLSQFTLDYMPAGAIILNKPISYFERNKTLLLIFALTVFILITVIALLAFGLYQKQVVSLKNNEISRLNSDIIDTQKDLIARLGDVIETRSHETASHVNRVAKISGLLAKKYGLKHEEVVTLMTVSPMHDVGKIGITENILHKPGKLTKEEFEIMKYHTHIGYEILKNTEKNMLKYASIVALEHHERWDGFGYPNGKSKEDIHIFARITAIADVYDALRSDRVYKKAWPQDQAVSYIVEEKGRFFEPKLVDLFVENLDEIEKIRSEAYTNTLNQFNVIYNQLKAMYEKI